MAAPLNGVGAQQIPLATTFRPGQSAGGQVRAEDERRAESKSVEVKKTDQAQPQRAEDSRRERVRPESLSLSADSAQSRPRGSLLDITV